ncbi:excinuclease ABC subunit A [Candidatus Shapirobacteria bacterium]|nr:excinuclease ABC subunit A [Candidatus Shapirobacteria bacterium]
MDKIIIRGAREHNLKNVDLEIPKNKLVVFTGVSGSGKSSLAFDTIYAEGQRRYVESLSAYARQFLGIMDKPDVDSIEGLSPAIAIDQKSVSHNPRSTVGTITEIYDYLRLLFARIGHPHCPNCGKEISTMSVGQIREQVLKFKFPSRLLILAPLVRDRKGEFAQLLDNLRVKGFTRVRIDRQIFGLHEDLYLIKTNKHTIEAVVDRISFPKKESEAKDPAFARRLGDSIEQALKLSDGQVIVAEVQDSSFDFPEKPKEMTDHLFSQKFACPACNLSLPEIEPRTLSFNSPHGACPTCSGIGTLIKVDEELAAKFGLSREELEWRYWRTDSESVRERIERFMKREICPDCQGARLKKEALGITIDGKSISDATKWSIKETISWLKSLTLANEREKTIAEPILKEVITRLEFLLSVGLDYLSLDRPSATLAGGESQRIRLASQIGSGLSGVCYVLDEPTIGLHQRDNRRLIETLRKLRDLDNTLIVVEHDREMMESADWLVDFGPGAGDGGGKIISFGSPKEVKSDHDSLTGAYLSGRKRIQLMNSTHPFVNSSNHLVLKGCSQFNLKNIDVRFPLGKFIGVTGVSGSGKSTLVVETLYQALAAKFNPYHREKPGRFTEILGLEHIDRVILVDQSPIGRTPRSNPATYTGTFTFIRDLFAQLPEARIRGYKPGRFSFNVRGGRCENCQGGGQIKVEMQFLPDIYVTCEVCQGKRYNSQTLEIEFKEKNISEILNLSIDEAAHFFQNFPLILAKLNILQEVGLGYIKLGQPAPTLSGGEAQRVKLATELGKKATGKTFYILDEPTTGLHFADLEKLLVVLRKLVSRGNTVVVVEHNLDVIKNVDWVIDLGPEGGDEGGFIVAQGAPAQISRSQNSYTGQFLKKVL